MADVNAGHALLQARRRAGFTQRELAVLSGVSQPAVARIERGREVPRVDTLDRLLRACGDAVEAVPLAGAGVDRTVIRQLLRLTPAERAAAAVHDAAALARIDKARPAT